MARLMGKWIAAAAFAAAMAGGAAYAVTIDSFFGNTVVVTSSDGVTNYYFDADGKVTATQGDQTMSGTWAIHGEELCLTPDGGEQACYPLEERAVGDTWSLTDAEGDTASLTLRAGR